MASKRVKIAHTEMCRKSEVTSVEEGQDVERVIVAQSESASIVKQLKDETSADSTALEKGVGPEDQSSGSYEGRDAAKVGETTTLEGHVQQRQRVCGLHARIWSTRQDAKE